MEKKWIILIGAIFAVAVIAFVSAMYYSVEELQKYDYGGKYSGMFEKKVVRDGTTVITPPSAFITQDVRKILAERLEVAIAKKKAGIVEKEKVTSMKYSIFGKKYLVSILPVEKKAAEDNEVKVKVGIDKVSGEAASETPEGYYIQGPEEQRTS